jgi:uncharacterized iron-regulated protein
MLRRPLLALLLVAAGCAPRAHGRNPAKGDWIVDGRSGQEAAFTALVDDLAGADVVFVGEDHDNPFHHEVERRIASAMLERHPDLAMGMEMLQIPAQPIADKWVAGGMTIDDLAKELDWDRTWGFPMKLYAPLFDLARSRQMRLFALNAPDTLVKKITKGGIEGLSPEEKAALPEMDLGNKAHEDYVRQAFSSFHQLPEDRFQRFYSVQVLWDETMADRTVHAMRSRPGAEAIDDQAPPTRPMVVFAGTGHLIRRLGIPSRVERRVPGVKTRVVLAISAGGDEKPDLPDAVAQKDADWLWLTP